MPQQILPRDLNGHPIQASERIEAVANVTLNASTYVAVSVPAGASCKSLVAKSRSGQPWYIGTSSSPSAYYTCLGSVAFDLVAEAGEVLFYALGSGADTLEVLFTN